MKGYILILLILYPYLILSQVGINTTSPNATLDIEASNVVTPSNDDGILIPRVDNFPATNPSEDQDGIMVFTTGNGTPTKGFYYWDISVGDWVALINTSNNILIDPKFPDGFENFTPITLNNLSTTNYTVPNDRNFYITNVYSNSAGSFLAINGNIVTYGASNVSFTPVTNPIIAGSGDVISSNNNNLSINGFSVNNYVTPITQPITNLSAYIVPINQKLVILSGRNLNANFFGFTLIIDGITIYSAFGNTGDGSNLRTSFHQPIFVEGGATITSSFASSNYNINGYLINN